MDSLFDSLTVRLYVTQHRSLGHYLRFMTGISLRDCVAIAKSSACPEVHAPDTAAHDHRPACPGGAPDGFMSTSASLPIWRMQC